MLFSSMSLRAELPIREPRKSEDEPRDERNISLLLREEYFDEAIYHPLNWYVLTELTK